MTRSLFRENLDIFDEIQPLTCDINPYEIPLSQILAMGLPSIARFESMSTHWLNDICVIIT